MTILASGRVAITQSDIFEVTDADIFPTSNVSVTKITLFNVVSVEQTTILYVKTLGTLGIELRQFTLKQNEGGEYLEPGESLHLENGDILQAETTTPGAVNFIIFGDRF